MHVYLCSLYCTCVYMLCNEDLTFVHISRHSQTGSTVAYSTLQLISLRSQGNGDNIVRKFVFKSRPIAKVPLHMYTVCEG